MAEVILYTPTGTKDGMLPLPDAFFAVPRKPGVVHAAIVVQNANSRVPLAHTKNRGEVRGGGKKPWRQKGTGRARHGSRRSPIWVGGGVTFGPRSDRNFSLKMNKATKRLALAMALSDKVANETFVAVTSFALPAPKTKLAASVRRALPGATARALVVVAKGEESFARAARNLPLTSIIRAASLNVRDVVNASHILISPRGVETIVATFTP